MTRAETDQATLKALRDVVRPRLLPSVIGQLRDTQKLLAATATTQADRREAEGLKMLLELHEKLEAYRGN